MNELKPVHIVITLLALSLLAGAGVTVIWPPVGVALGLLFGLLAFAGYMVYIILPNRRENEEAENDQ